jgi:hypothetical protein
VVRTAQEYSNRTGDGVLLRILADGTSEARRLNVSTLDSVPVDGMHGLALWAKVESHDEATKFTCQFDDNSRSSDASMDGTSRAVVPVARHGASGVDRLLSWLLGGADTGT